MKPTKDQFNSYQQLFEYYNVNLFEETLSNVLLNFSRKNQVAGFFSKDSWKHMDGEKVHEISINPTSLIKGKKYVLQTLVHEMCHLWQYEFGKPSRSGYHNKQWADKMESFGLMPSDTEKPGGKRTGQSMSDYLIEGGKLELLIKNMPENLWLPFKSMEYLTEVRIEELMAGVDVTETYGEVIPIDASKKNKSKYTCPSCKSNLWGKKELQVKCIPCDTEFEEQ